MELLLYEALLWQTNIARLLKKSWMVLRTTGCKPNWKRDLQKYLECGNTFYSGFGLQKELKAMQSRATKVMDMIMRLTMTWTMTTMEK